MKIKPGTILWLFFSCFFVPKLYLIIYIWLEQTNKSCRTTQKQPPVYCPLVPQLNSVSLQFINGFTWNRGSQSYQKRCQGLSTTRGTVLFWEKKDIAPFIGHNRFISLSQMKFLTNHENIVLKNTHKKQDTKQHTKNKILVFESENRSYVFFPPEPFCSISSECNCNSGRTSF